MAVDMELKKAFQDLSLQVMSTREKVRQIQSEIESTTLATNRARITSKTITSLGPQNRTYESVGRIFVLRPRDELAQKIGMQVEENEKKIKLLETNKTHHETKMKESENNIREMINQKKLAAK